MRPGGPPRVRVVVDTLRSINDTELGGGGTDLRTGFARALRARPGPAGAHSPVMLRCHNPRRSNHRSVLLETIPSWLLSMPA